MSTRFGRYLFVGALLVTYPPSAAVPQGTPERAATRVAENVTVTILSSNLANEIAKRVSDDDGASTESVRGVSCLDRPRDP